YDGTDCVMLSGETAAGRYPVEAVRTMASICMETEQYREEREINPQREGIRTVNTAVGRSTVKLADRVGAAAILCPTHTGRTARLISASRPHLPIVAFSSQPTAIRRMNFYWGVRGIQTEEQEANIDACYNTMKIAKNMGVVKQGDLVIITSGDPETVPFDDEYVSSSNMIVVGQVR
ncbi:MAG: pyruvate kinase, partial [Coriobacteriales bacterium]|nr:pyruvate kinase [Coriobacteriales bacterium]